MAVAAGPFADRGLLSIVARPFRAFRRRAAGAAFVAALALAPALAAFEVYPGAKPSPDLEAAANRDEVQIGIDPDEGTVSYFTSSASFEDVLAFYRQRGRDYAMPPMPGLSDNGHDRGLAAEITFGPQGLKAVPTGLRVKQAFIILDGAADITESRDWVTIIRPVVIGTKSAQGAGWRFTPVRTENTTAIVRMQRQ